MKRITLFAILTTLIVLAGCGSFWTAGVRVYDVQEWTLSSELTNELRVIMDSGNLTVIEGTGSNVLIVMSNYVDAGSYSYGVDYLASHTSYSLDTNSYRIFFQHSASEDIDMWNIYGAGANVVITLPAGMTFLDMILTVAAGNVETKGIVVSDTFDVETITGNIEIKAVIANVITVGTSAGNIDVTALDSAVCSFNIATGNLYLALSTLPKLDIAMNSGNIEMDGVSGTTLTVSDQTGNVETVNDGINFPTVTISSTAGNIDVQLNGVATFDLESVTGNIEANVESFSAAATSTIEVTTGNIDLNVNKLACVNLAVDAVADVGAVYNRIDFAKETTSLTHFTGSNGTGENIINAHVTTGNIDIDD